MGIYITEPRQAYIRSNAAAEAKPVVAVVWRGGEARRQKAESRRGDWEEEWFVPYLLGGVQKNENKEEFSDIEKGEGSGGSKNQTPI
jgi:hypothetical protein